MRYQNLRMFMPADNLIIPKTVGDDTDKHLCMAFIGENVEFLDVYRQMNLQPQVNIRTMYVPLITKPIRYKLTPQMVRNYREHRLYSKTAPMGDYTPVADTNFFFDLNTPFELLKQRFNIAQYNVARSYLRMKMLLDTLEGVPASTHERVLVYAINLDAQMSTKLKARKFFIVLRMLFDWLQKHPDQPNLPFDKIIMYTHSMETGGKFTLMFDKASNKNNISRIRNIMTNIHDEYADHPVADSKTHEYTNDIIRQSDALSLISDDNSKTVDSHETKNKRLIDRFEAVHSSVKNFLKTNPEKLEMKVGDVGDKFSNKVLATAILSHSLGDTVKAEKAVAQLDKLTPEERKEELKKHIGYILPRVRTDSVSANPFVQASGVVQITESINPGHLLEKRKSDFRESFQNDLIDVFNTLSVKKFPIKVKKISKEIVASSPSELMPSVMQKYTVDVEMDNGDMQQIFLNLPAIDDHGMFTINGQKKVLLNQNIAYPIFFLKENQAMFNSSYSSFRIISKPVRTTAYLLISISGYKLPVIVLLAYKLGLEKALKFMDVNYTFSDKKNVKTDVDFGNGQVLHMTSSSDVGKQIIESFPQFLKYIVKSDGDVRTEEYWQLAIELILGNKNSTYLIDQQWSNIVTPIEVNILESRGDPTKIDGIIKYMSEGVIKGRIDDRNSVDCQRVRTSEVFIAIIQKQIHAAYNEYEMRRFAGDDTAKFYFNPKVDLNIQNMQQLENINPVEELATMMKVTPVGVGGIDSADQFPKQALNVHDTYYGNIDPLETPKGPGVGVQQHLTIGSAITNTRGLFAQRDRSKVKGLEILSTTPTMIPFVESDDGCRVTMASGQMKQAIPLEEPEIPAIQTGFESIYTNYLSEAFIKKAPEDGVVQEVANNLITIQTPGGGYTYTDISAATLHSGQGKKGLSIFKPVVEVGDKVKADQIIAEGANIKDGTISNGLNVLATFMPWKGYNFEDGMVVSESLSKRFASLHIEEQKVYLEPGEDVSFLANIGDEIPKGEILLSHSHTVQDVETIEHLRCGGGIVKEIEIYSNVPDSEIPDEIRPQYEISKEIYKKTKGVYPIGSFKEKGEQFKGILVKFLLTQRLVLKKGDKINNRHFNKGVISIIEKDANMPVTPWGEKIDIVYSPLSVINRMNTGQLMEMHTSMISRKLAAVLVNEPRKEFEDLLKQTITLLDGTEDKSYSKRLIAYVTKISDREYEKLKVKAADDGFVPLIFTPFKSPPRENILLALAAADLKPRYPLRLPEFNMTTDPLIVGYIYVTKLEHIVEKKIHARGTGGYTDKTKSVVGGASRGGGQKLGEYDIYSLIGWNCPTLIDEFLGPAADDHVSKNAMINSIIQKGKTEFVPPRTNPTKDVFNNLMLAVNIISE